jgi:4-hydroxy-3-methylbut-2-enyl diphosphate reductase IspH
MTLKSRIEALEKRLARPEPEETVVRIREIIVHNREEVEQLRAAGLMDAPRENHRHIPRGLVRVVIAEVVDARDLLARSVPRQDEGQAGSEASDS